MTTSIDSFYVAHPWASDITGSLLGVCITALLFVAGIVYERRRTRALEARVYDEALYYFEQLLGKTVAWATRLARAYRNLAEGLRRAPLQPAEFAQLSDSAAQRLLEIDRQLLFKAFLHRYGRDTATIDLYVSLYDGLDYLTTQSREADDARAALLEGTRGLDAQFRKHLDALLTQVTTAGRALAAALAADAAAADAADDGPAAPSGLAGVLAEALAELHRLTLPGTELDEAFQVVVQPLHRTLSTRFAARREVQEVLVRTHKLLIIHASLVQRATDAANRLALLSTGLQLGANTLQKAQERLQRTAVGRVGATELSWSWRPWRQRGAGAAAARASSPSLSAQAETRTAVRP